MLFVPSGEPPHKTGSERDPIAPAELRLAWVRAAIAGNPRFAVDALEVERGGTSYSVETLRTLGKQIAPDLPVFVLGVDAFAEVGTWREPEALFTLANFAVITRPGRPAQPPATGSRRACRAAFELARDGRSARHRAAGTWARLLEIAALDISASEIRARLRSGRSVRYLLPETIREAVSEEPGLRRVSGLPGRPKALLIAEAARERLAEDVVALDVRQAVSFADTFIVATGRSDRHVRSIGDAIAEALRAEGEKPLGVEGYQEGRWLLMDLGDVIVHVFQPDVRRHYDLERLWSEATPLDVSPPAARKRK